MDQCCKVEFVHSGLGLIMPDSVLNNLHFDYVDDNTIHWSWEPGQCFAYKGMTQMDRIDSYQCGVLFRILCWLQPTFPHIRLQTS